MYFTPGCYQTVVERSACSNGPLELNPNAMDGSSQTQMQTLHGTRSQPGKTAHNFTRHFAVHHYRDRAHDAVTLPSNGRNGGGGVVLFPVKLHRMLAEVEREGLDDMVSWVSHGRCFQVHNPNEFLKRVLPRYFKMSKLASFQRQLYLYGFQRLTRGRDRGCYYHECFLRGRVDLAREMQRVVVKGTLIKAATNPDQEPNLYSLPPLPTKPPLENDSDGSHSDGSLSPLPTNSPQENDSDASQSDCSVDELIDHVDHSLKMQQSILKAPTGSMDLTSLIAMERDELGWSDFLMPNDDNEFQFLVGQTIAEDESIDAGMILEFCSDWAPATLNL